jgi:hypothetical protein
MYTVRSYVIIIIKCYYGHYMKFRWARHIVRIEAEETLDIIVVWKSVFWRWDDSVKVSVNQDRVRTEFVCPLVCLVMNISCDTTDGELIDQMSDYYLFKEKLIIIGINVWAVRTHVLVIGWLFASVTIPKTVCVDFLSRKELPDGLFALRH